MHYYIISGELSGDLYGSYLIEFLKTQDSNSQFTCWGGHYMQNAGGNLVVDLSSLSFMGFWEVFKNSKTILKNLLFARKHIKQTNPDAIILIDYPGFNLHVAKYAKSLDIPVFWFIAPQIWAWKSGRIKKIKKYINTLFVALPFELEYFRRRGVQTFYFGHPMIDIFRNSKRKPILNQPNKPIIALLPGSRIQEIRLMLPVMLKASCHFSQYQFVIICANNIKLNLYEDLISGFNVELRFNKDIFPFVDAAVVASGTASLELAMYNIPQVVCYKLNPISFLFAKLFSRVKYISLVNILADQPIVEELIQHRCNAINIESSLKSILEENNRRKIRL